MDTAIDARREPFGTQCLEPAVEPLAGLAVEFVGRVAQRQNGKTLAIELRRFSPLDELEKARRRLRGVSLAIGADDDQHILFLNKLPYLVVRSDEHTSELQSLMRISYAVFCLQQKN